MDSLMFGAGGGGMGDVGAEGEVSTLLPNCAPLPFLHRNPQAVMLQWGWCLHHRISGLAEVSFVFTQSQD